MNLIEMGKELLKLGHEYRDADAPNSSEWVEQGLMTPEEYQNYKAYQNFESKAYYIRQEAEQAVPYPKIDYPEKYATLKTKHDRVTAQIREIETAMEGYNQFDTYRGYDELSHLPLATKVNKLRTQLADNFEYHSLKEQERDLSDKLSNLTRKGTVVARLKKESGAKYHEAQKEAVDKAHKDFMAKNQSIIDTGEKAERAMEARVRERQQAIVNKMAELLNGNMEVLSERF